MIQGHLRCLGTHGPCLGLTQGKGNDGAKPLLLYATEWLDHSETGAIEPRPNR